MGETNRGASSGVVRVPKKQIEEMRGRVENECVHLSRLALAANHKTMIESPAYFAEHLLLAVYALDLEIRALASIEAGELRST
jgi:hypothetical protein